jgi:hypothetical protein
MSGSTVLSFARAHLDRTVGRGECWDLANEALSSGGDRTSADFGRVGRSTDYVWGTVVPREQLQPGDIIQFSTFTLRIDETRVSTRPDGSGATDTSNEVQTRTHHTVVVEETGPGGRVTVLEQNYQGVRRVARNTFWLVSGTTETRSHEGGATIVTTRRLTVTGSWHCYRPQARSTTLTP